MTHEMHMKTHYRLADEYVLWKHINQLQKLTTLKDQSHSFCFLEQCTKLSNVLFK